MPNNSPFFILGNPRSGTTLLRLMLDAHSKISVPPECGFMIWFYESYKNANFNSTETIKDFIIALKSAKKIESWKLNFVELEQYLVNIKLKNYSEVIDAIYNYYSQINGRKVTLWGDKNNFYINHIEDILKIFPNAKFVHLVRDGRDVACSYKELNIKKINSEFAPNLSSNISEIAKEWHLNNEKVVLDAKKFSSQKNYFLIRYEDLILDSKKFLSLLTGFLGVKYESRMLNYHKVSNSYEPQEYLQWKANTTKPVESSRVGRYKLELERNEIEIFNSIALSSLKRYDYDY